MTRRPAPKRRLIVPVVLAVTVTTAVVAATTVGCGDDAPPRTDAGITDAPIDTPIV